MADVRLNKWRDVRSQWPSTKSYDIRSWFRGCTHTRVASNLRVIMAFNGLLQMNCQYWLIEVPIHECVMLVVHRHRVMEAWPTQLHSTEYRWSRDIKISDDLSWFFAKPGLCTAIISREPWSILVYEMLREEKGYEDWNWKWYCLPKTISRRCDF